MPRPRRSLPLLVLATALLAFPLGALASHQFADVPDSNPFHADISALVNAGVTSGCGGGNYCPSANVTREQMAAFLNRLGALAPGKTPVVNATKLDGLDSSDFLQAGTVTHQASCAGPAWNPANSAATWNAFHASIYNSGAAVSATFYCPLDVPDGASITAATFSVWDVSATEEAGSCSIVRVSLATMATTTYSSTGTSGVAFAGGVAQLPLSMSPIAVDRQLFSYNAWCTITGNGDDVRIIGVTADYEVSGI